MKSWSISTRFAVSIIVFSLPLIALTVSLYQAATEQILFSQQEVHGSVILNDFAGFQAKVVRRHLQALSENVDFKADEKTSLAREWQEVLARSPLDAAKAGKLHESFQIYLESSLEEKKAGGRFLMFNQSLMAVREAIADGYNVILDPDLDSYYTMDLIVNLLPQLQETYLQLAQFAGGADDIMFEFQKSRLVNSQIGVEKIFKSVLMNLDKIHLEDPKFYGAYEPFQAHYGAYQDGVREQLREIYSLIINADRTLSHKEATWKTLSDLSGRNMDLVQKLTANFAGLLEVRMAHLKSSRSTHLTVSILVTAFAIAISAYFGLTISRTIKTFREAVQSLRDGASTALEVGQSLTKSSAKVSTASATQAAAIEETSASLEELSSMVSVNAQNSAGAKELASEAKDVAVRGASEMENLMNSMTEISSSSQKIEEIMQLIDDIAFQTNLLALNASVEAARAGEHGKGFAVVADAVRTLAQKSAGSAKEIHTLISESQEKVEMGRKSADRTGEAMRSILQSVEKVSALNGEIAGASQEQMLGIQQISKAVTELEQTTIENSGVAKQSAEYSSRALQQAEELMRIVDLLEGELQGQQRASSEGTDFNFQDAIQAHLKWKARLRNFIQGQGQEELKSATVCQDNQCPLGKWIYGAGTQYKQLASYGRLKTEHAFFHEAAGEIVRLVEQGKPVNPRNLEEGSEFDRRTQSTIAAIQELAEEVG